MAGLPCCAQLESEAPSALGTLSGRPINWSFRAGRVVPRETTQTHQNYQSTLSEMHAVTHDGICSSRVSDRENRGIHDCGDVTVYR